MKILFIGCVEFSKKALKKLISIGTIQVVGIVTRKESTFNNDFCSLESIALEHDIPCYLAQGNNQIEMELWIKNLKPDIIYCFGWSYLLNPRILEVPRLGVIGYHPAALPKNRGRHPIIWALALGLETTASTFFVMDSEPDSGDIISQEFIKIEPYDDAGSLYEKLSYIAMKQIAYFTNNIIKGIYYRISQDHSKATYWRKRTKKDGVVDWRMSAQSIHNLVRALTRPYVGAHFLFHGKEIKIWKTDIVPCDEFNIEPGKVLKVIGHFIVVKCGSDAIKLINHELNDAIKEGSYL